VTLKQPTTSSAPARLRKAIPKLLVLCIPFSSTNLPNPRVFGHFRASVQNSGGLASEEITSKHDEMMSTAPNFLSISAHSGEARANFPKREIPDHLYDCHVSGAHLLSQVQCSRGSVSMHPMQVSKSFRSDPFLA